MDVLSIQESIRTARYRNQFVVNVTSGISSTILNDPDKIFFITEIHCTSETIFWSINYESYNPDPRCSLVSFDSSGDYYAYPGNEIVTSKIRSATGMKYIKGFYVQTKSP